jgi:SAM-dependent methyltransferase
MTNSNRSISRLPNTGELRSVAHFYDDRVDNQADLNARLAQTASRPPHHHSGMVREDETVPDNEDAARIWLYHSEKYLCDFLWQVIVNLSLRSPRYFLDLGCGEGGTAARFGDLCDEIEITGVSLSDHQISMAQHQYPRGRFIVGNMLTVDIPGSFDVIYSIEATEYLGVNGLAVLMKRAYEWLKPGGLLTIISGSFVSKQAEVASDLPEVAAFDHHYQTCLSASDDYRHLAIESGFSLAADINLGPITMPYWRSRRDHPGLRNSPDGTIETLILRSLEDGLAEFHLWAWYRGR